MATLVFFHGLNTFGDDDLHIGPLRMGLMHSRLSQAFKARGRTMLALTGLGAGTPEDQASTALSQLLSIKDQHFCLLGHSVGGLVARALSHRAELKGRIQSVITFGTPHHGAYVAEQGLEFSSRHPHLNRALGACGYRTDSRRQIYAQFTPERLKDFNRYHPLRYDIPSYSLLCEARGNQLGWPLQLSYRYLHPRDSGGAKPASDGFIWSSSQRFGESLGPFALDHFAEIGFFFQLSQVRRIEAEKEFERMLDLILELADSSRGSHI